MGWLLNLLETFLGAKDEKEIKKKAITTSVGTVIYWTFEYGMVFITASIVALLQYWNLSQKDIFLILWAGCIVVNLIIIWASEASGVDFTLFGGYARLTKKYQFKNIIFRTLGWLIAGLVFLFWIFWQGPAPIVIFLKERKEISQLTAIALVVVIAFVQMIIWTKLYILGLETISDIYHHLSK